MDWPGLTDVSIELSTADREQNTNENCPIEKKTGEPHCGLKIIDRIDNYTPEPAFANIRAICAHPPETQEACVPVLQ